MPDEAANRGRERGFTLIEVMVAVLLLALGLSALVAMQITAVTINARANGMTRLVTMAQERLELLLALPYNHPHLLDTAAGAAKTTYDVAPGDVPDGHRVYWCVNEGFPRPQLKTIDVVAAQSGDAAEDSNLNCALDAGEDANDNGRLDQGKRTFVLSGVRSVIGATYLAPQD
jgi:prepilin-type N-terminal cleavage/methylation domain-containing protein